MVKRLSEQGQVIAAVIRSGSVLRVELDRQLREVGLKSVDLEVLRLLDARAGLSAAALARNLRIRRQSLQPLLDRMEDAELLDAVRCRSTGRVRSYSLAAEGRVRLNLGTTVLVELERLFLSVLPQVDRREVPRLLSCGLRAALREQPVRTVFTAML